MQVALIDDHAMFRQGLQLLLIGLDQDLHFSEAASCAALFANPEIAEADLVLLDLALADGSSLALIDRVRAHCSHAQVVVVSGVDDRETVREAIEAGAAGFVPKSAQKEVLISALRLVLAGGVYLPPHVLDAQQPGSERLEGLLSTRQIQALMRAVQGASNKHIARELGVAEGTVKAHLSAAYRALGVTNRTSAVYAVAQRGLTLDRMRRYVSDV